MSFKPLNIESEDESEDEIDDTKELQIEEALKLYQIALKYHSDGPKFFEQAAQAYDELFKSDIFKYPESQAELRRIELYGPLPEIDALTAGVHFESVVPTYPGENAPSTLPQVLHLAHKNYGEFILAHKLQLNSSESIPDAHHAWSAIRDAASVALDHFVEALDKDDTDIDVWTQSSTVGQLLSSQRVARFCLESVFDIEEDGMDDLLSFPGLNETVIAGRLHDLAKSLCDTLSLLQAPLNDFRRSTLKSVLVSRLGLPERRRKPFNDQEQQNRLPGSTVEAPGSYEHDLTTPKSWSTLVSSIANSLQKCDASSGGIIRFVDATEPVDGDTEGAMEIDSHVPSVPDATDLDTIYPGGITQAFWVPLPAFGDLSQIHEIMQADDPVGIAITRKRSNDAADLGTPDTGRIKSKRIRARESLLDNSLLHETGLFSAKKPKKDPYEETVQTDRWCFASVDAMLSHIGARTFQDLAFQRPKTVSEPPKEGDTNSSQVYSSGKPPDLVSKDLYEVIANRPESIPRIVPLKATDNDMAAESADTYLTSALAADNAYDRSAALRPVLPESSIIETLLASINSLSLTAPEVGFALAQWFLGPNSLFSGDLRSTAYLKYKWPSNLKQDLVHILRLCDQYIYRQASKSFEVLFGNIHFSNPNKQDVEGLMHIVQTILELHLEVLTDLKLGVTQAIEQVHTQSELVQRWADLARDVLELRRQISEHDSKDADNLSLRFIWTTVTRLKAADKIDQQKVLACMQELRQIFVDLGEPEIYLPNNAVMPALSRAAIDQEVAKFSTSEFFTRVFDSTQGDPTTMIEGLEPLLEHVHKRRYAHTIVNHHPSLASADPPEAEQPLLASAELISFLCSCSDTVILALWQRLRVAYQTIEYNPMIAICHFRSIEILVAELDKEVYTGKPGNDRLSMLMRHCQKIHDACLKVLDMTRTSPLIYECMDSDRARNLANALVRVLSILQYANFAEDDLRVGERQPVLDKESTKGKPYRQAIKIITDCQLSAWVTLYMTLTEALKECMDVLTIEDIAKMQMDMLRSVHTSTGLRDFCSGAGRILLNLLKKEVPRLKHVAGYDLEFSQVLVDLYDLNCFVNPTWEQLPHECSRDVSLDRAAAVQVVDLLLLQAAKIKPAELHKHSLRDAFERVNVVVARKKPTEAILRNREIFNQFFKSPINPLDLYRCLNGEGEISLIPLPENVASLANKGWYFTMGYIALTRFRSQKRVSAGPTEELDTAISFFTQDLEYGAEKWETWFRLAQAFDSKLEDNVSWSAEKLNKAKDDIAQLERSAIHCYRMATALATRSIDATTEATSMIAELYADFATRMYASSRPPFSMRAFANEDFTRFLSIDGLEKVRPFETLKEPIAWKLAKTLYQRAISINPDNWYLYYMLSKCLWKLWKAYIGTRKPTAPALLPVYALKRAIELLPKERRDKKEPILEPHYKLVSIIHKLVIFECESIPKGVISVQEACELMNGTPFAAKAKKCEHIDEWDTYVLNVLKQIRHADKANWHHRMIVRCAKVIFGGDALWLDPDYLVVIAAKHELAQQLFTKTMTLQAWRPELERSGRHFVFTHDYTRFFVHFLRKLNDRASLDQLVRRVRKRPNDYYDFDGLWAWLYDVYVVMLRQQARVTPGHETSIFSGIEISEFYKRKELLETYCHDSSTDDPILDILREAIEFKKVNQGLVKPTLVDELIGDVYALLFETAGNTVWLAAQEKERVRKAEEDDRIARLKHERAILETRTVMNVDNLLSGNEVKPQPKLLDTLANGDATDTASALPSGEQTPVKRKVGVGRREVRNAAEACVTKPVLTQTPIADLPKVQIVIPGRRSSQVSSPLESVHDSADDESELSEVDEDVVREVQSPSRRRSMFPNLNMDVTMADAEEEDGNEDEQEEDEEQEGDTSHASPEENGAENDADM